MKRPRISGINPMLIGKQPTATQKIINRTDALGIKGIQNMQGTGVTLFDTVILSTNAARQTLTFFQDTNNKSKNFTNWQGNQLLAGESLAVEWLIVSVVTLSGNSLTSDATNYVDVRPLGYTALGLNIAMGMANFQIANQTVLKDYRLTRALPEFNPENTGIQLFDNTLATPGVIGRSIIRIPGSGFVLPPNLGITFTIQIPPITAPANTALMVEIGDTGSIFASKQTM